MVAERLVWVLKGIQGLSSLQFGFRRFRSTGDPLLRLEHDISVAFENGKFVHAVFFDLQKVYDTTWKVGFCVNSFLLVFLDTYYLHPTFGD